MTHVPAVEIQSHDKHTNTKYECTNCSAVFETEYAIRLHRKAKHINLICHLCNSFFTSEEDKSLHSKNCGDDSPHVCQVCNRVFKVQCTLIQHRRVHSMEATVRCEICRETFTEEGFKAHRRIVGAKCSSFKCHFCPEAFVSVASLSRHTAAHENKEQKIINMLTNAAKTTLESQAIIDKIMRGGKANVALQHKSSSSVMHAAVTRIDSLKKSYTQSSQSTNDTDGPQSLVCSNCNKTFVSQNALDLHCMLIHKTLSTENEEKDKKTDAARYECVKCRTAFDHHEQLTVHLVQKRECHIYKCSLCKECFHNEELRREHQTVSGTEQECHLCSKTFKVRCTLTQHLRVHRGTVNCEKCHVTFTEGGFKTHKETFPRGECVLKCPTCGDWFDTEEEFKTHKETFPRGECVFKCRTCLTWFNTEDDLNTHVLLEHKNTVTLMRKCFFCDDMFHNSKLLSEHLLSQHLESVTRSKKHACQVCHVSYRTKAQLRNHVRSHTGEKPFKCDQCEKSYATRSGLYSHNRAGKHNKGRSTDRPGPSRRPKTTTYVPGKKTRSIYPIGPPIPSSSLMVKLKQEESASENGGSVLDHETNSHLSTENFIGGVLIKLEKPDCDFESAGYFDESRVKTELLDSSYDVSMGAMGNITDDFRTIGCIKSETVDKSDDG